ncbi:hypothetical protein D3C85_1253910 [compost metagenome]
MRLRLLQRSGHRVTQRKTSDRSPYLVLAYDDSIRSILPTEHHWRVRCVNNLKATIGEFSQGLPKSLDPLRMQVQLRFIDEEQPSRSNRLLTNTKVGKVAD